MLANPLTAIPLLLAIILYAGYLKIAARLVGRAMLPWSRAIGFAAFVSVGVSELLYRGAHASPWIRLVFAVAIHLGLGTWFFSRAARARSGEPLGWRRALGVVAVTFGLLLVTALVLAALAWSVLENLHLN
jgi:hypothetical protein